MWRVPRFVLLSLLPVLVYPPGRRPSSRMDPVAPVAYVPAFSWTGFYLGAAWWIQRTPNTLRGRFTWGAIPVTWDLIEWLTYGFWLVIITRWAS
jgi:hypothetical protein